MKKGNVCFVVMKNDREGKGGNYLFRGMEENRRRKICTGEQLGGIVRYLRGPRRSTNHCLLGKSSNLAVSLCVLISLESGQETTSS